MNSKNFDRLIYNDKFMHYAIEEAIESEAENGIPVGSVIVRNGKLIGKGHNRRVQENNPIMHAELCCIQDAAKSVMDLQGTTLYTTHMPCYLCSGAIIQFGISKVIAGESETLPHARHILEKNSVEVVDLDLSECKVMLRNFIARNSKLWHGVSKHNFFNKKNSIADKLIISYSKQKYVNFYQYPPPVKASYKEKYSLPNRLGLDEEIPKEKEFTLFVSIPYCRTKCNSCSFFKNFLPSITNAERILNKYLSLLIKQIKNYANVVRFSKARCDAVYIGGGTASLMTSSQVEILIRAIKSSFNIKKDAEITFEGNPSDMNKKYLKEIKKIGINRLSIGLQSFKEDILKKSINVPHDSKSGFKSVKSALDLGFDTVNVDLLYGVPGQKKSDWRSDLKKTISMVPQSITIYHYIIHSGSASEKMIQRGLLPKQANEKEIYNLYLWASRKLNKAGYFEKRFGCFTKPGHEQKYSQLSYNLNRECIGIGAGSYSFINGYLCKTLENIEGFKNDIENNIFQIGDYVSAKATEKNRMERHIMNNLFSNILDRKDFLNIFNQDPLKVFPFIFAKLWRYNLVTIDSKFIRLTVLGKRYIQNILYEFYAEEFK